MSAMGPPTPTKWAQLRADYPSAGRISVAMRLALDVQVCADLLAGRPVDPARLDAAELKRARERRLVRLDLREIDLLEAIA